MAHSLWGATKAPEEIVLGSKPARIRMVRPWAELGTKNTVPETRWGIAAS